MDQLTEEQGLRMLNYILMILSTAQFIQNLQTWLFHHVHLLKALGTDQWMVSQTNGQTDRQGLQYRCTDPRWNVLGRGQKVGDSYENTQNFPMKLGDIS